MSLVPLCLAHESTFQHGVQLVRVAIRIPLWIVEAGGVGNGNELRKRGDVASPEDIVHVFKGLLFVETHKILI
jgi:hypothetical protein